MEAELCVSACTCTHFSLQPGKVYIIVIALVSQQKPGVQAVLGLRVGSW